MSVPFCQVERLPFSIKEELSLASWERDDNDKAKVEDKIGVRAEIFLDQRSSQKIEQI